MAKAKNDSAGRARKSADPERSAWWRRFWIHAGAAVVVLFVGAVAFALVKERVAKRIAFPAKPPTVVLKSRPAWMSDFVAQQIATQVGPRGAHSAFDHEMLVDIT